MDLLNRFLKYISFDTRSDECSDTYPSTAKQLKLLGYLADEMRSQGFADVVMDDYGYVTGTIPATEGCEHAPVIGFLAHVDTSPDMSGADVKPQLTENYDGGDVKLGNGFMLRASDFPELAMYRGHTLITTDGTTLLGADDKAGVAEIMTAAGWLLNHPEVPHGKIRVGFTPDEEIGRGVDYFDVKRFGAQFAYTVDGGHLGMLEYENFNAAAAKFVICGRNIHPGCAKGRMINALRVACEIDSHFPAGERPETTEGYEGFYHLTGISGDVDRAVADYIIRDHLHDKFRDRKEFAQSVAAAMNEKYGQDTVALTVTEQYLNMREVVERHPEIIDKALEAMKMAGVEPIVAPIRGGTDGARLSYMGLPCPNLFTGGLNFHSRYECISLQAMQKAVETIINLARL